jgi:hypothetical protein
MTPGWGSNNYDITLGFDQELIEFIEFAFQIMGIDLTYADFKRMSDDEKRHF